jgi:hypothetical protein
MPVLRANNGSLLISPWRPRGQFLYSTQVWADSACSGAYQTCESLGQLADYADVESIPDGVLAYYGDRPEVFAFALLGWMRGRELVGSTLSDLLPARERKVGTRTRRPQRQREQLPPGVVMTPEGHLIYTPPAGAGAVRPPATVPVHVAPATNSVRASVSNDRPGHQSAPKYGPGVKLPAESVLMTRTMLARVSPEARKALRALGEDRWVDRTVARTQRLLASKFATKHLVRDLEVLCWDQSISPLSDFA